MSKKRKVLKVSELFKFNPVELKNGLRTDLSILFEDDQVVEMRAKDIIFFRFILDVYEGIQIPIISDHNIINFYKERSVTNRTINDCLERIMKDVVKLLVEPSGSRAILETFWLNAYRVVNNIYNHLTYDLTEYCTSISITELLKVQYQPELLKAMQEVDKSRLKLRTSEIVEKVNKTYDILDNILKNKPGVKELAIARDYRNGVVKQAQVKQLLASRGFTTEIDSNIFKYPIASSFTLGMKDLYDLSIESRSGAKALFLSNKAIQESEYFARELQLNTMVVERLVDGDCGSKDYIDWLVRSKEIAPKSDIGNLLGKYFYNPDTQQEEEITEKHTYLEGKIIKLRSSLNCKLEDHSCICTKCFGTLANTIPRHSNIGHFSSTSMTEKITQSILSTKHLTSSASSGEISIDDNAKLFFTLKNNSYYLLPEALKNKKLDTFLIIQQYNAFGVKDLNVNTDVTKLNPTRVSIIYDIVMRTISESGEVNDYPIKIKDSNKKGSLSIEFLQYIIENGYTLDEYDRYVFNINKWNCKNPIINMPELEYDFLALAKNIKFIFKSIEVDKKNPYKSIETPESLLQKVFDTVNMKLDVNIALLEVVVYAFTVMSIKNGDYRLGRNSDDRQLVKSKDIIAKRSLGAGYGWQYVSKMILSPDNFYNESDIQHPLDVMVCPQEVITRYHPNKV